MGGYSSCAFLLSGVQIHRITCMTWEELASCQHATARHLMATKDPRFARGVCSRAYYAAFAMVTARLPQSLTFGRGWQNPEHAKLTAHVSHIAGLSEVARRAV